MIWGRRESLNWNKDIFYIVFLSWTRNRKAFQEGREWGSSEKSWPQSPLVVLAWTVVGLSLVSQLGCNPSAARGLAASGVQFRPPKSAVDCPENANCEWGFINASVWVCVISFLGSGGMTYLVWQIPVLISLGLLIGASLATASGG